MYPCSVPSLRADPETTTVQQPSHRLVDRAPVTDGDRIARPRQGPCRIWFACSFGDSVPARLPECLLCAALTWAEAWSRETRASTAVRAAVELMVGTAAR